MSTENSISCVNINELIESARISLICPICSTKKKIDIPKSILSNTKNLTTVSIPEKMVCAHHFQAFIDQNFKVRGYQKVDYILKNKNKERDYVQETKNLVENLVFKNNFVEYSGVTSHKHISPQFEKSGDLKKKYRDYLKKKASIKSNEAIPSQRFEKKKISSIKKGKKKSLREIYEDFWEYIDEDNETFRKFLENDERRKENNLLI
jgi:hypothetical protein